MTWTVHELRDLGAMGYHVRVRGYGDGPVFHIVEFQVFEVLCWPAGSPDKPEFARPDVVSAIDNPTTNLDEAAPCLSGEVKWDGCSNMDFHTSDCMAHYCGKDRAIAIGVVIGKVYDFAKLLMPTTWSKECWGEPATSATQPPKGGV